LKRETQYEPFIIAYSFLEVRVMAALRVDSFLSPSNWSWRKAKQRGV
jgi:hypothetical protein